MENEADIIYLLRSGLFANTPMKTADKMA